MFNPTWDRQGRVAKLPKSEVEGAAGRQRSSIMPDRPDPDDDGLREFRDLIAYLRRTE